MFNSKNIPVYIASLGVIFVVGTLAKKLEIHSKQMMNMK